MNMRSSCSFVGGDLRMRLGVSLIPPGIFDTPRRILKFQRPTLLVFDLLNEIKVLRKASYF